MDNTHHALIRTSRPSSLHQGPFGPGHRLAEQILEKCLSDDASCLPNGIVCELRDPSSA